MENKNNETKLRLEEDIQAVSFLKNQLGGYSYVRYSRTDLLNDDSILTGASVLNDANYFNNPDEVIRYFEKARHYSDEVTIASFIDYVKDLLENGDTDGANPKVVDSWLTDYEIRFATDTTMDLDDVLEGLKSDLTLYE